MIIFKSYFSMIFHIYMTESQPPVISFFPSRVKTSEVTSLRWPFTEAIRFPVAGSYSFTVPSSIPAASDQEIRN